MRTVISRAVVWRAEEKGQNKDEASRLTPPKNNTQTSGSHCIQHQIRGSFSDPFFSFDSIQNLSFLDTRGRV